MKPSSVEAVGHRSLFTQTGTGTRPRSAVGGGRRALFSAQSQRGLAIQCDSCEATTPVGLRQLWYRLTTSVHVPFRAYPIRMRCPACGRFSWCRVTWAGHR